MSISPLLSQLANRVIKFHESTGISQSMMAAAINMSEGNYSSFLRGNRGIGAESTCLLLKFTNMQKQQAIAKLTQSPITSKIMLLQEQGQSMRLDTNDSGAYVPGLSGSDPNDDPANTIVDPGDAPASPTDENLALLRNLRKIHRQGIRAINGYINSIPNRASVNRSGTTEPTNQRFSRR
jgi:hypothetical protein